MSRTTRGSKGPGHEYWSRRPGNKFGGIIGTEAKKHTHGIERAMAKGDVLAGLSDTHTMLTDDVSTYPAR